MKRPHQRQNINKKTDILIINQIKKKYNNWNEKFTRGSITDLSRNKKE